MKICKQIHNELTFPVIRNAYALVVAVMFSLAVPTSYADVSVNKGWNLLGNSNEVSVATTLANSDQVISVWAWDSTATNWKFYSPSKSFTDGGAAYATGKGYTPLTKVAAFQGFWVNASTDFVLPITGSNSTSTTASPPITTLLNNTPLTNSAFYVWTHTVGGQSAGERQSGFLYVKNNDLNFNYSGDDTYRKFTSLNRVQSTALNASQTGVTLTDTFTQQSQSFTCPMSTTLTSLENFNGGLGFTFMYYQNMDGSNTQCESNKTEFQTAYPLDTNFTSSSLKGKTLKVAQICGSAINQISITTDASGNFSISGTICSIKQQNYFNAVNVRNVSNPTVANGTMADVSDFPNLVRLTPSGYNASMRAALAPTMLLSRSVDGLMYYFNLSDGGSPGQLAGGLLPLISLQ